MLFFFTIRFEVVCPRAGALCIIDFLLKVPWVPYVPCFGGQTRQKQFSQCLIAGLGLGEILGQSCASTG